MKRRYYWLQQGCPKKNQVEEPSHQENESIQVLSKLQAEIHQSGRGKSQQDRRQRAGHEMPVAGYNTDTGQDSTLKDHRSGDIADRQGVLVPPEPDNTVELLRQFCGYRGDDQRQEKDGNTQQQGDGGDLVNEQLRPADRLQTQLEEGS